MRAVVEKHGSLTKDPGPPAIRVTIVAGPNDINIRLSDQGMFLVFLIMTVDLLILGGGIDISNVRSSADLFSFSHTRNASRMEVRRIGALRSASSRRKGLTATVQEQVEDVTALPDMTEEVVTPRLGIGLTMSNIYATCVTSFCIHVKSVTRNIEGTLVDLSILCLWTDGVCLHNTGTSTLVN